VDDLIYTSNGDKMLELSKNSMKNSSKNSLKNIFSMIDLGNTEYFLGVEVKQTLLRFNMDQ
jgi:hypothetical protein